jgi:hypothetical protein
MTKTQRFNSLILVAVSAALPALAQTSITNSRAPRPQSPYTVEFKTTHVQTLANGTTITTETKEVMARDPEMHRMNSITEAPRSDRPPITSVHVTDPATGDQINWNSTSTTAHEIRYPAIAERHGCWATPSGRYRANYGGNPNADAPLQPLQPLPPPADAASPVASPLAQNNSATHFPTVTTGPDGQDVTMIGVKHTPGEAAPAVAAQPNATREDLGADTIMGVQVRGSRSTVTTPAGAMGNDQPLVSTNEIWMAPSLGMVLRSISDDPRMGKTDREVVSVDLNSPDPALFQPPAGYELVTEEMQPVACPQ